MSAIKDLSPQATITYNGTTFGNLIKTKIRGEMQYDEADRVVTHVKYTMHVHGWVWAASVALENTAMNTIHDNLSKPGMALVIEDLGFDQDINTGLGGGAAPDVLWGAKPRLIEFQTFGGIAAEVVWVVEFNLSRCNSQITANPFLAFNYAAEYERDEHGLTTRTLTGYAQVPATRTSGGRTLLFNVDSKWDRITAAVPFRFRRASSRHRINEAKNRIDFSITDREIPGEPLPPGVVESDLRYEFGNTLGYSFLQWMASLSGSVTVAPGVAPAVAGGVFFTILASRIAALRTKAINGAVLPVRLRLGRELFGRTSSFSCQFSVSICLAEILSSSGLWQRVGTDYRTWATSMQNVWSNRGVAGLRFNTADDRLVDACVTYPTASIGNDGSNSSSANGDFAYTLACQVNEKNSYLAYRNDVKGEAEMQSVLHKFAQSYSPSESGTSYIPHVHQYQGSPELYVSMSGSATRIKFKPEIPNLTSVGGLPVTFLANKLDVPDTPAFSLFDCPVYKGRWLIVYKIDYAPGNLDFKFTSPRPGPCGATA